MPSFAHEEWINMNALALAMHRADDSAALEFIVSNQMSGALNQHVQVRITTSDRLANYYSIKWGPYIVWWQPSDSDAATASRIRGKLRILEQHLKIAWERVNASKARSIDGLTRRQQEVVPFLLRGLSNSEIAHELGISARTVEKHVAAILKKMQSQSRVALLLMDLTSATAPKSSLSR